MAERVLPNESAIERQDADGEALLARLQDEVRAAGLWAPHVPPEAGGTGTGFLDYAYLNEHIGRSTWGQRRLRVPGTGRGQRRDPAHVRHRRAEGALAAAARRRADPLVLLDDRARGAGLRPDDAPHARGARRRRMGDRRPQVVLVGSRRRGVRDRDGRHRPRRGPARPRDADHRPRRHAGRRRRPPDRRHGSHGQGLVDALRGALHRRPRAGLEHARRRGRRLPDRAEAPRPGPHPPRDALARPDAARLRADVHLRARPRDVERPARRANRRSRTGSPTPTPRSRPAG